MSLVCSVDSVAEVCVVLYTRRTPDYQGDHWPAIEEFVNTNAGGARGDNSAPPDAAEPGGAASMTPNSRAAEQRRAFLDSLPQKFYTHEFKQKNENYAVFVYIDNAWHYGSDLVASLGSAFANKYKKGVAAVVMKARLELGGQLVADLRALKEAKKLPEIQGPELSAMRTIAERSIYYRDGSYVSMNHGAVGVHLPGTAGTLRFDAQTGNWLALSDGEPFNLVNGKWKPLVLDKELQDAIGEDIMTADRCRADLKTIWSLPWNARSPDSTPSFRHYQSVAFGSEDNAKAIVLVEAGYIRGQVPNEKAALVFYSPDDKRGRLKTSVVDLQMDLVSKALIVVSNTKLAPDVINYMTSASKDANANKRVRRCRARHVRAR